MTIDQYNALVTKRDSTRVTLAPLVDKIGDAEYILHKIDNVKKILIAVENDSYVSIRAYGINYTIDFKSDKSKNAMLEFLNQAIEDLEKEFKAL